MRKILIGAAICTIFHGACYAIAINITPSCVTAPDASFGQPDSTCTSSICSSSVCPTGSVTVPTGYSGSITRGPIAVSNNDGTFSCVCGVKSGTLTCASGYTGTASYRYSNGLNNFTGCTKNGGSSGGDCDGTCTNCTSTLWTDYATGYQNKTTATCNTVTCKCTKSTDYRCAAGYYKSGVIRCLGSIDGSASCSGCSRCPPSGGIYGSSAPGSTAITACYIPTDTSMSDSTGTYTYTSNCYYSE